MQKLKMRAGLTLESANQILRDRALYSHQYQLCPSTTYHLMQIQLTGREYGNQYRLIGGKSGKHPFYEGTLRKCLEKALQLIENCNYQFEALALEKLHIFCYLPHVTNKPREAYPADVD